MKKYGYILVGSGLYAGVSAWYARKNKKRCLVVEERNHIGGDVYREDVEGIHMRKCGTHIFHTDNREVWGFMSSLAEFNHYTNGPVANCKGQMYNIPFNMNTFSRTWGIFTPDETKAVIEKWKTEIIGEPKNLEEQAVRLVGRRLYEKLIKGYTERQWGRDCKEFPALITKRVPVQYIYDNNYSNDPYQGIPVGGYNVMVRKLFKGCNIETSVDYLEHREHYDSLGETAVHADTIGASHGYRFDRLGYRNLHFESQLPDQENHQGVAVVNCTDRETPYTRVIGHKHSKSGTQPKAVITRKCPVSRQKGMEPYYPANDQENQELYQEYEGLTGAEFHVLLGGHLGGYKCYGMDKITESAMNKAKGIFEQDRIKDRKDIRQMIKTQDRQAHPDVAKGMGVLGMVANHCLVETSLGTLFDWYDFFMLAVFRVYTGWWYAPRCGKGRTGISSREMVGKRLISLGIPYVCYSVLFIFSRIFLIRPQRYTFLVLMSDICYTGALVGLETPWFLPNTFVAELLLNMIYGSRRKMGIGTCLVGMASVFLTLYINGSKQDAMLWRVIHLPPMVYIKGLAGFLLALGGVFIRDAWQKAFLCLKGRAGLTAVFLLMCSSIALTALTPGYSFNFLTIGNPVSWVLITWFSPVIVLMFGGRTSAYGGSWKEWPIFGRVFVPFFTYYGTHSLTVMYTCLVPVITFFKVAVGRMIYPGVLGNTPWDILFLALMLAVEPGTVRLIETRLPWMNGRKKCSR